MEEMNIARRLELYSTIRLPCGYIMVPEYIRCIRAEEFFGWKIMIITGGRYYQANVDALDGYNLRVYRSLRRAYAEYIKRKEEERINVKNKI